MSSYIPAALSSGYSLAVHQAQWDEVVLSPFTYTFTRFFFQTQIPDLCPCYLLWPQFSHFRLYIFFNFLLVWFFMLVDNFCHISTHTKGYD